LGGRYVANTYSETANTPEAVEEVPDSVRLARYARWLYDWNPTVTVSLNYERESADYDSLDPTLDFERQDAFARFDIRSARDLVVADIGKTAIQRESLPEEKADLRRLTWARQVATDSTFRLAYLDQVSDEVSGAEQLLVSDPLAPAPSSVARTEFYRIKRLDLGYDRRVGFVTALLRAFGSELRYENTTADNEDDIGGDVGLRYDVSTDLSLDLTGAYIRSTFPNIDRVDHNRLIQFRGRYRITRSLALDFSVQQEEQASTDPLNEYTEHLVTVGVLYASPIADRR
jgi:hypothetical protein